MPNEKNWENLFALAPATPEPREHNHSPGECNESCLMAREVKCVCKCGGANHGAHLKKDVKHLDEFDGNNDEEDPSIDAPGRYIA